MASCDGAVDTVIGVPEQQAVETSVNDATMQLERYGSLVKLFQVSRTVLASCSKG